MSSDEDVPMTHILEDSIAPIAKPLVSGKLLKRLHKLVTKATKEKLIKRGVKEAVKAIRKGSKGYALTPFSVQLYLYSLSLIAL
jgi:hypothetical protein